VRRKAAILPSTHSIMIKLASPDLTQFPPRSARVQLGGYVHLPRLLDKARATAAGKNGDYHYNCPLDGHFFTFTGIDAKTLLAEAKKGRTDSQMLAWVRKRSKRLPSEVAAWGKWMGVHAPGGAEGHAWISGVIKDAAKSRDDVFGFFDLLDLDDYVSFGGQA
jgi:hypothetical protein